MNFYPTEIEKDSEIIMFFILLTSVLPGPVSSGADLRTWPHTKLQSQSQSQRSRSNSQWQWCTSLIEILTTYSVLRKCLLLRIHILVPWSSKEVYHKLI